MNDIILKFICMPMAMKIFKDDKEEFKISKASQVYFNLFDSVIEKLQEDFNKLKVDMYTVHHLDIKRVGKLTYTVNKEEIEFTAEELRDKTEDIMREYIAYVEYETKERVWGK